MMRDNGRGHQEESRKFIWAKLTHRQKSIAFAIIVIGGWLIRMGDITFGILFSIWYIAFVRILYPNGDRKAFLGFRKPRRHWGPLVALAILVLIAGFLPFYLLSSLCPMHLFDPILHKVYVLVGNDLELTIIVMYLAIGTFTVYAEELFFRGFLQDAIDEFAGLERGNDVMQLTRRRMVTLLAASLLFGVSHINLLWTNLFSWAFVTPDGPFIVIGVLCLSGVGFLFGLLRIKANSIWPAMLAHAIANFFMVIVPAMILFA